MRLGFAIAAHLDADVLLLDEVFAVGDEAFQRKCFGKIFEFKQRGGTIVFVSHDAVAGRAALRARRAAARGPARVRRPDPRGDRALPQGARRGGRSGRARRRAARVGDGRGDDRRGAAASGAEGEERQQFLAGEPFSLRLRIEAENGVAPPQLQLELRDEAGLLVASDVLDTGSVGWARRRAGAALRRRRGCRSRTDASTCGSGSPTRAASAAALARRRARLPRLPGRRGARRRRPAGRELDRGGELRRRDELAHVSRLARADGARAGPPVHALHGRRGAAAGRRADDDRPRLARRRRDLLRPRRTTSSTPGTPTRRWPRRCATRTGTRCASTPTAAPAGPSAA